MRFLTLSLFLVFSISLVAQDEPCDAIPMACGQADIAGTFTGNTLNPDLPSGCFITSNPGQRDIWFTFEADGEQGYLFYSDVNIGSQGPEHIVKLYRSVSGCDDLISVRECHEKESFHEVFPEGIYYVQVRERLANGSDNEFTAGLVCSAVSENDLRCNATTLNCGQNYSGSLIGSSNTEETCDPFSFEYQDGGDVWFQFEAEDSQTYDIYGKSGQQLTIYESDSCGGALIQVSNGCYDKDIEGFVGDGMHYVCARAVDYLAKRSLSYQIALECGTSAVNQDACNAIEIPCGQGSVEGSTSSASANQAECSFTFPDIGPSVFYKYDSQIDGDLELYVCNFDEISVFTGSCEELDCLSWGGSTCSTNPLSINVSPGIDYYIMVWGGNGDFELFYNCEEDDFCAELNGFVGDGCDDGDVLTYNTVITSDCECIGDPIPTGTLCQNAIPITQNPLSIDYYNPTFEPFLPFYHTINDIPPFLDSLGSGPFTQGCYAAKDVVFSFTPEVDKFVDITASITDSNVEPNITILTGCPFTTAHVAEGCGTENFFVKKIENFHALADTTYYILIDGQPQLPGFDFNVDPLIQVVQKTFCPDLAAFQFDPCDDGNPNTTGETINEDCECEVDGPQPGDFCQNAIPIQPSADLFGSSLNLNTEELSNSPFDYCLGSSQQRVDTWLKFEILSSVMAIKVQGAGDFDAVLEVWKNGCNGFVQNQLACQNDKGPGQAEIVILDEDLIIGNTLKFRVYHTSSDPPQNKNFSASVTFVPKLQLVDDDCVNDLYALSDTLRIDVSEFSLPVKNWVFAFQELETPFQTYFRLSPNGKRPGIRLNQVPPLELGRSYEVKVRPIFNGGIEGDFGEPCEISIAVEEIGLAEVNGTGNNDTEDLTIELYPNILTGTAVTLELNNLYGSHQEVLVEVYDLYGKKVHYALLGINGSHMTSVLSLPELDSGIYLVYVLMNKTRVGAKKLVIR
jgi:hypothetical protein